MPSIIHNPQEITVIVNDDPYQYVKSPNSPYVILTAAFHNRQNSWKKRISEYVLLVGVRNAEHIWFTVGYDFTRDWYICEEIEKATFDAM